MPKIGRPNNKRDNCLLHWLVTLEQKNIHMTHHQINNSTARRPNNNTFYHLIINSIILFL